MSMVWRLWGSMGGGSSFGISMQARLMEPDRESGVSLYMCPVQNSPEDVLVSALFQGVPRVEPCAILWGIHAKTLDPIQKQYLGVWSSEAGEGSALECASPAFASTYFEKQ